MIRAAKICGWALVGQTYDTLYHPFQIIGLCILIVFTVPLMIVLSLLSRLLQNQVIGAVVRSRSPQFVRKKLLAMLTAVDVAELSGHAGHQIICWDCHHTHKCQPPKRGETLDHSCHLGECPHEKLK